MDYECPGGLGENCPRLGGRPLIQQESDTRIRVRVDTDCESCNDIVAELWGYLFDNNLFKQSITVPLLSNDLESRQQSVAFHLVKHSRGSHDSERTVHDPSPPKIEKTRHILKRRSS